MCIKEIDIGGRKVGTGHPCFIIAEAGVNHNGDPNVARKMVDAAVQSGADAIKFQTFKADRLTTLAAPKAEYQLHITDATESQYEMLCKLELPDESYGELMDYCTTRDILFMSTPFDEESADLLADLGMLVFKTPSGELTNLPFLAHIARKDRPMIISTGMSCLGEVEAAVNAIEKIVNHNIVLLHCVSDYPANPKDVNLRAMQTMAKAFDLLVGYSDHTLGTEIALAAVVMGASVIEKHFTLDRSLTGPDHRASLEPDELKSLVSSIRIVESALGNGRKEPTACEKKTAAAARRSLVASRDLQVGSILTEEMISFKRPGTGLPISVKPYILGRTIRVPVKSGELLSLEMIA
jgi:N,N'-diacetyllegionaminate synthase